MFKRLLVVCVACVVASFCFASEAADVYVSLSAASPIGSIPGGQTMVDIGRFNFTVNTADVGIEKLVFQVWTRGNAGPADALQNIRLFYQTTKVGVTIAVVPPNGKVVFTLSPKYVVPAFTTKTFTVKADITPLFHGVMGINLIKVRARDMRHNRILAVKGLPVKGNVLIVGTGIPAEPVEPGLSCSLASDSPKGTVYADGNGHVEVLKFVLEAKGADIFVPSLSFRNNVRGQKVQVARVFVIVDGNINGQGTPNGKVPVHIIVKRGQKKVLTAEVASSAGLLRLSLIEVEAHADIGGGSYQPIEVDGVPLKGNWVNVCRTKILIEIMAPARLTAPLFTKWGKVKERQ